ncbi:MAG: acyl carrier protein [bacterium]
MEKFLKLMEEIFDKQEGSVAPTDHFRDYETWNSLQALTVVAMINQEYDVTIPRENFAGCDTVESLFQAIMQRCSYGKG